LATLLTALSAAPLIQLRSVSVGKAQAAGVIPPSGGGGGSSGGDGPTGFPPGIDSSAKKIISGPIKFEYTPTDGGKTAVIVFHSWHPTEADLTAQVKAQGINSYTQDDFDDLNNRVNGDGDLLSELIGDPEWDACEGGQIASSPSPPQSQNDAACNSNAKQVSNAIYISLFDYKGTPTIQYVMPAPNDGGATDNQDDLLNGTGSYFPKFYKANDQTTGGAIPGIEDLHHNVHYYYATGFGGDWLPLKLGDQPKRNADGPALYFGHSYSSGDVLSGAIDAVLGLIDSLFRSSFSLISDAVDNAGIIPSILSTGSNVPQTWGVLRDAVDVMFLLILIVIAFANTVRFDVEAYGIRALLPRFIVAVILVNFGLFIVQFIIDFSNVLMSAISTLPQPGKVKTGQSLATSLGEIPVTSIANFTFSLILLVAAFILAIFLWVLMQMRILVVWFLAVVSPIAFLMMVLPITRSLWLSWWKQFIRWILIGPAVVLILWIGSSISGGIQFTSASDNLRRPFFAIISMALACIIPITLGGKLMSGVANRVKRVGKSSAQLGSRAALSGGREAAKGKGWVGQGQTGLLGGALRNAPLVGLDSQARRSADIERISKSRQGRAALESAERMSPKQREKFGISNYAAQMELSNQAGKLDKEFSNLSMDQLHQEYGGNDSVRSLAAARRLTSLGQLGEQTAEDRRLGIDRKSELDMIKSKGFQNDADIYKNMRENQPHAAPRALGSGKGETGDLVARSAISKLTTSKLDTMSKDSLSILAENPEYATLLQEQISPDFVQKSITGNSSTAKTQEIITKAALKQPTTGKAILSDDALSRMINDEKLYEGGNVETKSRLTQLKAERPDLIVKKPGPAPGPGPSPAPGPAPAPFSTWNAEDGYTQGEHGEFPAPDDGGEEQE
jgi:hypothetical protein